MRPKTLAVLTAFILLFSIELSLVERYARPEPLALAFNAKIGTALHVQVIGADGNVKTDFWKDNDLLVNNFRKFLASWMTTQTSAVDATVVLKDTANTDRTFCTQSTDSTITNTIGDSSTGSGAKGGFMGIGTGTNAPTLTDYQLQTILGSIQATTTPTYDLTSGNVTVSSTFAITGSYTITEGASYCNWVDTGGTQRDVMLSRDTFSGVSVVNGDTFVFTIVLTLSTNFNHNFGYFLKGLFTNCGDGSTISGAFLKATDGAGQTLYIYGTSGSNAYSLFTCYAYPTQSNWARVGTSAAALSRTYYVPSGAVEAATNITPAPYLDANGYIILTSDTTLTAPNTISEWVFAGGKTGYVYCVYFRVLASPAVSLLATESCKVTVTITL